MKVLLSVLSALLLFTAPLSSAQAAPNYSQIIANEAAWVASAQIPTVAGRKSSGAIAVHKDPSNGTWTVWPYNANIGARAMLAAGSTYYPKVKAWMAWYLDHANDYWPDYNGLHGTVYDYRVSTSTYAESLAPKPNGDPGPHYDSTDSYASTFLVLAKDYAQTTGDYQFLRDNQYMLNVIGDVMNKTQDTDKMTWSKPDWKVKYLMDNAEVYEGMSARSWITRYVFNDPAGADWHTARANEVKSAVQTLLWKTTMYSPAKHSTGVYDTPSWSEWYPSATGQAFPIHTGLDTGTRASSLYNGLNSNWPNWKNTNSNPDKQPWMTLCYTAAVRLDKATADACLSNASLYWSARPWPWTVLDSGMTALAAKKTSTI